jgi:hypothetical protein
MDDPWMPPISTDFSTSSMDIHPDGPGSIHGSPYSATSWNEDDGCFSYPGFYNNMIDFFEHTPGPVAEAEVWALVSWWTLCVRTTNAGLTPTENTWQ